MFRKQETKMSSEVKYPLLFNFHTQTSIAINEVLKQHISIVKAIIKRCLLLIKRETMVIDILRKIQIELPELKLMNFG